MIENHIMCKINQPTIRMQLLACLLDDCQAAEVISFKIKNNRLAECRIH
jgi:hypothetical protein